MIEFIKKYLSVFSVSGCEDGLASIISTDLSSFADNIYTDSMGNLIVYKKGLDSTKKLMLAAHMDEIGFIVTHIDDNGFIRVSNMGGVNSIRSSYCEVVSQSGVKGVIICEEQVKPADLAVKKLVIDIGAKNKKQAEKKVGIGDFFTVSQRFTRLSGVRYAGKAIDDRIGCSMLAEAAKKTASFKYDTYFVFTVQEEVGCRGSKAAANALLPDYGLAVDVTPSNDVPGSTPGNIKLGNGAAVKVKDSSVICSRLIVDRLTELAKLNNIPYQYEILLAGGTDTSSMQVAGAGCHAGCISLPVRYVHSPVETFDLNDYKAGVSLLVSFIESGI